MGSCARGLALAFHCPLGSPVSEGPTGAEAMKAKLCISGVVFLGAISLPAKFAVVEVEPNWRRTHLGGERHR